MRPGAFTRIGALAGSLALFFAAGCDDRPAGDPDAGGGAGDAQVPSGPRAVLEWQMRCPTEPCPSAPSPARAIDAVNGQDGHEVSCDLTIEGSERRFNLTARQGSEYGIEIRGGRVGLEGGRLIGSLCQVRVYEQTDETVFAPCTSSSPSADRACQIQRIDIRDVDGVPTLLGELRCVGAAAEGDPTRLRDVTAASAASGHAAFTFTGCEGL